MNADRRNIHDLDEGGKGKGGLSSTTPELEELRSKKIANESADADLEVKEAESSARAETLDNTRDFRNSTFEKITRILLFIYCHIAAMIVAYLYSHFSGNSPGLYYTALTIFVLSMLFSVVYFILNRIYPAASKPTPTVVDKVKRLARRGRKAVDDEARDKHDDDAGLT